MRRDLRKRKREVVESRKERTSRKNSQKREVEVSMATLERIRMFNEEALRKGKIVQSIISQLPPVDLTAFKEPCVIMHTLSSEIQGDHDSNLLAWFPERRYVGVVTNTLLSHKKYIHLASSGGFLCGLHLWNLCNTEFFGSYLRDWTLKLAVCNPATGFKMKLPPLDAYNDKVETPTGIALIEGDLEVKMSAANRNQFRVHVIHNLGLVCTVYTYKSGSQGWESSSSDPNALTGNLAGEFIFRRTNLHAYDVASRTWTGMAHPGKDYNDYPLPPELPGDRYFRLFPFRHGSRVLMVGSLFESKAVVLLELEKDGTSWRIVTWAPRSMFPSELVSPDFVTGSYPLVCGKLLVLSFGWFLVPAAFHLENNTWLGLPSNVPTDVKPFPLQTNCVYNP